MSDTDSLGRSTRVFSSTGVPFISGFTTFLPEGHEKILKQAFYNAIAVVFVGLASVAAIAVYLVLQPFLRSLLWAVLFGSALHPFKQHLTRVTKEWLIETRANNRLLIIGGFVLPFKIINWSLNGLLGIVKQYAKLLAFIFVALLLTHLCLYYFTFTHFIITFIRSAVLVGGNCVFYLQNWCNVWVTASLAVTHLLTVTFWWSNETRPLLVSCAPFVWITVCCKLFQSFGTFGILILTIVALLVIAGLIGSLFTSDSSEASTAHDEVDTVKQISTKLLSVIYFVWNSLLYLLPSHPNQEAYLDVTPCEERAIVDNSDTGECDVSSTTGSTFVDSQNLQSKRDEVNLTSSSSTLHFGSNRSNFSNGYLYALLWSCILAQIWLRPHLVYLLLVPLALLVFKWILEQLNNSEFLITNWNAFKIFLDSRKDALFSPILSTGYQYLVIGDRLVCESLQKATDSICSLFVIFTMLVCVLFAAIFLAVQVYHESTHLVLLTGNLVNSTVANSPELSQLLPANIIEKTVVDEMIANAYVYGRNWIKNNIYIIGNDEVNANASRTVEKQILEVWDRAYHLWLNRSENLTKWELNRKLMRTNSFDAYDWERLFGAFKSLNFAYIFNVLKENIDIIISVFDSVWSLLKGNITLLFTTITAVLSLLFNGSSAILNCFLSLIVFSTSLFYLLCSSGEQYKPVELASRSFPVFSHRKSKNKFGQAVEEAINSVFAASLKMTAFYGLYTWLTHTLFEVQMVFIPSVLAALFGAVPFIGAYWASLPAVIELWLVNGSNYKSILMAICAMLPSYFVDSSIYSDIKGGGHPYLTALAIAGGVFYLGAEGALFGPIILCCLFVAGNVYSSIMSETPLEPESTPLLTTKTRQLLKRQQTMN